MLSRKAISLLVPAVVLGVVVVFLSRIEILLSEFFKHVLESFWLDDQYQKCSIPNQVSSVKISRFLVQ